MCIMHPQNNALLPEQKCPWWWAKFQPIWKEICQIFFATKSDQTDL